MTHDCCLSESVERNVLGPQVVFPSEADSHTGFDYSAFEDSDGVMASTSAGEQ